LQQQYGLVNGKDHGRIWRVTHARALTAPPADMSRLKPEQLAVEVGSPHFWRRQTARRLLVERQSKDVAPILTRAVREARAPAAVLGALETLDGLAALKAADIESALAHADPGGRRQALRFAERLLDGDAKLLDKVPAMAADKEPWGRLQLALSLGEGRHARALAALVQLARVNGDEPWMASAVLTAVPGRGGALLAELLRTPANLNKAE